MSSPVSFDLDGNVAWITLRRPEARNAINAAMAVALEEAVDRFEHDDVAQVAVLAADATGQERPVFCAGADLHAVRGGDAGGINTARGGFAGFVFRERTKPVIAAVDGLATAGGCEIVLACDMVVATTRSQFGLAEVKRNLIAAAGGLWRLPRVVGQAVAMEVVLTGEPLEAHRAHQLGLVNRLCEPGDLVAVAGDLAHAVARNAPLAVRGSREVVLASAWADDRHLRNLSSQVLRRVTSSEDTAEGLAAFAEKRPPRWKGR